MPRNVVDLLLQASVCVKRGDREGGDTRKPIIPVWCGKCLKVSPKSVGRVERKGGEAIPREGFCWLVTSLEP